MRKALAIVSVLAALSIPYDAQADGSTWSMPYMGSCNNVSGPPCLRIAGTGTAVGGFADVVGVHGSSSTGIGVKAGAQSGIGVDARSDNTAVNAVSTNGYGVLSSGFVGARAAGVIGLQGSGVTFGLEVSGGTSPIKMNGTLPSVPQNPLCKSTSGSAAGHVGFCSSTRALKEGITELDMGTDTLMRLRPVAFRWKSNHSPDFGFVAEDVAKVNRLLAVYNENGQLQSVKYTQITALLTKALQEQVRDRAKVEDALRKQVNQLGKHNTDLTTELLELRQQNAALTSRQRELQKQQGELLNLVNDLSTRLSAVEQHSAASK